jgi:ribosome assembly protein 4
LNVNFSPNGKYVASGSGDSTVRIWGLDTELPLHELNGHKNWVLCVLFSPDCKKLVSGIKNIKIGCRDGIIKVWDVEKGKKLTKKPLKGYIYFKLDIING